MTTLKNRFEDSKTNSTYTLYTGIIVKGNEYHVLVVNGNFNYINISKKTNNPFGIVGKDFKSFDEATLHYKAPEMKVELLKIELGLV